MADEINYDYESMDNAYENMKRISDKIRDACSDMTADATRLLESSASGQYALAYKDKVKVLNDAIEELNTEMTDRAKHLQEEFNRMGQSDIKLGDGF